MAIRVKKLNSSSFLVELQRIRILAFVVLAIFNIVFISCSISAIVIQSNEGVQNNALINLLRQVLYILMPSPF